MSKCDVFCARTVTVVLVVSGALRASAGQTSIEANGPISLPEPPSAIDSPAPPISAAPTKVSDRTDALSPSEEGSPSATEIAGTLLALNAWDDELNPVGQSTSRIEQKPLGLPKAGEDKQDQQSEVSTQNSPAASAESSSLFKSLDPRENDVTKVIGALAIVVGLLVILRLAVKRMGGVFASGGSPSGVLEILARYPVGRGQQLMLLKVARRIVLVHHHGSTMTSLSEMTDPDEVAAMLTRLEQGSGTRDAARFRKTFSEFMAEHQGSDPATAGRQRSAVSNQRAMSLPDAEIVDLTRRSGGWFKRLISRGGSR